MIGAGHYTVNDFAALIGVSVNRVRHLIQTRPDDAGKMKRVGETHIIDADGFFWWYRNGGNVALDNAFPRSKIAHDVITKAMDQFYGTLYKGGDRHRQSTPITGKRRKKARSDLSELYSD